MVIIPALHIRIHVELFTRKGDYWGSGEGQGGKQHAGHIPMGSLQCCTEHLGLFSLWPHLCDVFKTSKTALGAGLSQGGLNWVIYATGRMSFCDNFQDVAAQVSCVISGRTWYMSMHPSNRDFTSFIHLLTEGRPKMSTGIAGQEFSWNA